MSDLPDAHITSVGQFVSYLEAKADFDGLVFRGQRLDKPLVSKWTFNPLAVLWFVVERLRGQGDGVIWILQADRIDHLDNDDDALTIDRV